MDIDLRFVSHIGEALADAGEFGFGGGQKVVVDVADMHLRTRRHTGPGDCQADALCASRHNDALAIHPDIHGVIFHH